MRGEGLGFRVEGLKFWLRVKYQGVRGEGLDPDQDEQLAAGGVHPQPCLHPQPYTLNPQPYTLNPQPCTLNPTLANLHPQQDEQVAAGGVDARRLR